MRRLNSRRFQRSLRVTELESRLTPAGQLDATFGTGGIATGFVPFPNEEYVNATAIDSQGRTVVAGNRFGGSFVARYTDAGQLDTSFGSSGVVTLAGYSGSYWKQGLAIDATDRVIVSGGVNGGIGVVRLTGAGAFDVTFDADGMQTIPIGSGASASGIDIDSLGRIIVGGSFYNSKAKTSNDMVIARLTSTGAIDVSFGAGGTRAIDFGGSESVHAVTVDAQDRVVVAGTNHYDFFVARLTASGLPDSSFDGDGKKTVVVPDQGSFNSVATDSHGRVVLGGRVYLSGNGDHFLTVRLLPNGALDSGFDGDGIQTLQFGSGMDDEGAAVVVDSQDRVLITGFSSIGINKSSIAVARYTTAGALDVSFNGTGTLLVGSSNTSITGTSIALTASGAIVIGGFAYANGTADIAVARIASDGLLDSTFGDGGMQRTDLPANSSVTGRAIAIDGLGRTVVVGDALLGNGYATAVSRFLPNGAMDTSFGTNGVATFAIGSNDYPVAVAVDTQNRIIIAGSTYISGSSTKTVARLTPTGALDLTFDGDGKATFVMGGDTVTCVAIDSQDRVLIGGSTGAYSKGNDFAVTRLTINGGLDPTFDGDGKQVVDFGYVNDRTYAIAVDPLGRILLAGMAGGFDGGDISGYHDYDFAVARLTPDGGLDNTFDADGKQTIPISGTDEFAYGVDIDSLGRVVLGGYRSNGNDFVAARLTSTGAVDTSFGNGGMQVVDFGSTDRAYGVAVDSQDRVILGGTTGKDPNTDVAVARLTSSGVLDSSFATGGKLTFGYGASTDYAYGVAVDDFDRVEVAGYGHFGLNKMFAVARLTGDVPVPPPAKVLSVDINAGPQRSMVTSLTVTFDSPASFKGAAALAFQLTRQSDGEAVALTASVDVSGAVVTLNFTGGAVDGASLADGRYTLTILANQFKGHNFDGNNDGVGGDDFTLIGDPATNKLYRLFGDANGDGFTDLTDFRALRFALGSDTTMINYNAAFDINGDGFIGNEDFLAFRSRLGVTA